LVLKVATGVFRQMVPIETPLLQETTGMCKID
jgi:hypothetical protein